VRLSPVTLPASAQVRLRRLAPGATYRDELAQLLLPIPEGVPAADGVRQVVEELLPVTQGDSNSVEGSL
jgi:transcription-repair coupling factor (superfamily II helicase)